MFKGDDMAKKKAHEKKGQGVQEEKISRRKFMARGGKLLLGGAGLVLALSAPFKLAMEKGQLKLVEKTARAEGYAFYVPTTEAPNKGKKSDITEMLADAAKYRYSLPNKNNMNFKLKTYMVSFDGYKGFATNTDIKNPNGAKIAGSSALMNNKISDCQILEIPIKETDRVKGPLLVLAGKDDVNIFYWDKKESRYSNKPGFNIVSIGYGDWKFTGVKVGIYIDDSNNVNLVFFPSDKVTGKADKWVVTGDNVKCFTIKFDISDPHESGAGLYNIK